MNLKEQYKQLTSIDIEEQKRIWDERGKGYYGEYKLFCELYKKVDSDFKILMNLRIPVTSHSSTEIDLLLIDSTGIYVFEVKHFSGTIYGKDTDSVWTQYFRTTKNNTFKNPIIQNGYHLRAIKDLFPEIPIRSFIVFTNSDCDIKVNNHNKYIDICTLDNIANIVSKRRLSDEEKFSPEEINNVFIKLSKYSKMQEPVVINGTIADFKSWVQPVICDFKEAKEKLDKKNHDLTNQIKRNKRTKFLCILATAVVLIFCVVTSILIISKNNEIHTKKLEENTLELNLFKQNFLHVDQIEGKFIEELNSFVNVSNVSLFPHKIGDSVSFKAKISIENDTYGIALTKESKYIVTTKSGKVYEYDVFGEHLPYHRNLNIIGKGISSYGNLATIKFFKIYDPNEITYIKITGVEIFKTPDYETTIAENLEIELYAK